MIPTGRIPLAEPVSTGNIRLGTWTFSYGGLTVCIRRHDSGLARYFVATVGKRLWATVLSRVFLDLCSQRSNCFAGSLLVASAHTASRWRSVVGVKEVLKEVDKVVGTVAAKWDLPLEKEKHQEIVFNQGGVGIGRRKRRPRRISTLTRCGRLPLREIQQRS